MMTDRAIRIECKGAETRQLDELVEFQGELKSLSEANYLKFRQELITEGFAFAIHIWKDPSSEKTYVIGGHQRIRTLKKMRDDEGFEIPPLPVSIVFARDWKHAKRRVLQDINQYGKVERQGLYEFMVHADMDVDDIMKSFDIPQVNMESFKAEFFDVPETEDVSFKARKGDRELDESEFQRFDHRCPRCSFEYNGG